MGLQIYIPETVVQAIRSPEEHLKRTLTIELQQRAHSPQLAAGLASESKN